MTEKLPLIPYPSGAVAMLGGTFSKPSCFAVSLDSFFDADQVLLYVREQLGMEAQEGGQSPDLIITAAADATEEQAYHLEVNPKECRIEAKTLQGVFYAVQTLRQLLLAYPEAVPCCRIEDKPALLWRAFMLDVARSFCPVEEGKRIIDILASFKMNVLHLHLSDDQGWRIASESYPKLGEGESGRYSKQEIKDLVAYAQARHIMVIPEIDMPGHFTAALASYPKLSCTGGPFTIPTGEGIFSDILCVGKDEALSFVKQIIEETASLFPAPYIHLGGDEIPLDRWVDCPDCQKRKRVLRLSDEKALLRWFLNEMTSYARGLGKQVILYNDYVDEGYDKKIITQVWNPLLDASALTHPVIMSDYFHTYLDMDHTLLPLPVVYRYGKQLQTQKYSSLYGSEFMLWTEYIATREERDFHLFPRLIAGAESFWTRHEQHDYRRFVHAFAKYGHVFLPSDAHILPKKQWKTSFILFALARYKRRYRVKRNSRKAGISLS